MAFEAQAYANEFLLDLDQRTVADAITNDNYTVNENGESVTVYAADPLVANSKNADNSVNAQNPGGSSTVMAMDQEKDLTVVVGTVEEFQSSVDIQDKFQERQLEAADQDIDDFVMGFHTDADASNEISTTATSASGFDDKIREAKVNLSENDVPRSNRFMVLSPGYADIVAEAAGDRLENGPSNMVEREGYVGRYQGFDIFETSGVKSTSGSPGKRHLMYGHTGAITMARQIQEATLVPSSAQASYHGDVLKFLLVYGAQTFLPNALGVINADQL